MSCDSNKFIISKGTDNTFVFTVKQDDSTAPMVIDGSDTFFASLILLEGDVQYLPITNKPLTATIGAGGKITLFITSNETTDETGAGGVIGLIINRSDKVDRYYLKPTYRLLLECNTVNNGNFVAKVAEVYVD